MRIMFIGTPEFAVPSLSRLVELDLDVCMVVTRPDSRRGRGRKLARSSVKEFALCQGFSTYQPEKFSSEETKAVLERVQPEIGVIVAYGEILKSWIINSFPGGLFNLHASLLPQYRGAAPINHAILNGEKETGVTVQRVVPKVDAGPILAQRKTEIGERETAEELHDRLKLIGAGCLGKVIAALDRGEELKEMQQDEEEVSTAPKLSKPDGRIDWNQDAEAIRNQIRALTPWPGAYCHFKCDIEGQLKVLITKAETCELEHSTESGTVMGITEEEQIIVASGNGRGLVIQRLKPAGSREMSASDFVHGRHVKAGDKF